MTASFLTLSAALLGACHAEKWNLLASGPWGAREGLMGTYYDGFIWMSGGRYSPPGGQNINQSIFYNDVWKLDPACLKSSTPCAWQLVSDNNAWEGRGYHIMVNHTVDAVDYMYVIGGQNLSTFYNDVWRSTDGIKWQQVTSEAQFHVRAGLAAVSSASDGMLYVSSGCYDEFPNRQTLNDLWRSKDGAQWQQVIANTPDSVMHVRSGPRVQIWDDVLYIVAGEHGFSETTQLGDVWSVDLSKLEDTEDNAWDLVLDDAVWANRSGHGFVIDDKGTFYVIAGYYDLHDLWRSKNLGRSWERVDRELFNCKMTELHCGRYDFWAQRDDQNNLFLYGGDSNWNTFGGESNETFQNNLDSYP